MFPHGSFLLQATWWQDKRRIQSGRRRSRGPESTRSSNNHARKKRISERDQPAYLMTGGSVGSVWFSSHGPIFFSLWTARIARSSSDGHDDPRSSSHLGRLGIARSPSVGHDDPRFSSHLGDTWNALERLISIGRATLLDNVEPSSAIEVERTAMIKREPQSWLTIVPRSWLIHR